MLRAISAVIAGSFATGAVLFAALTVAFLATGAERAFQPKSFEVSSLWLIVWFAARVLAAIAGGWACAVVGESRKPVLALAALVLLVGADDARKQLAPIPQYSWRPRPAERSDELMYVEAMNRARVPPWAAISAPLVEVAGVILGGRLKRGAAPPAGAERGSDAYSVTSPVDERSQMPATTLDGGPEGPAR